MTTELAVQDHPPALTLFRTDDPVEVVARASKIAQSLADVIRKQKLTSRIGDREYVRVEGWTLCGSMLGVFPVTAWTRQVEGGWEARVEAKTLSGAIVGAAEAQCTRDEANWASRDEYALRSMAQTRAVAKALRLPLGFVVAMAGFEATPAEEMPSDDKPSAPHGVCAEHGVPYFQSAKMRSPAHRLDSGGWCNKPEQPAEAPRTITGTAGKVMLPHHKAFTDSARQRFATSIEAVQWARHALPELTETSMSQWTEAQFERLTVLLAEQGAQATFREV